MNRSCTVILRLLLVIGTLLAATAGAWSAQPNVVAIQGGGQHVLGLKGDGSVIAWGSNNSGQTTVPAAAQSEVAALAAGTSHSLALKSDGSLVAWGASSSGQTTIPGGLANITAIAAGGSHSLALKEDGTVVAWGANASGQATVPAGLSRVIALAAGATHSLALKRDGTVVAWGSNASGQATVPADLTGVVAIAAGGSHSLALKSDGTVVAWGLNTSGQATVPGGLAGVIAIAAGGNHSLALKNDGTVAAWGANDQGQTTLPAGLTKVVAITAGTNYSHALKSDGSLVNWGSGVTAAAGAPAGGKRIAAGWEHSLLLKYTGAVHAWGDNTYGNTTVPAAAQSGIVSVAAGRYHSLALGSDGTVTGWGANSYGQAGSQSGAVAIAAGEYFSLALKDDGSVIGWGRNNYGQTTIPTEALSGVVAVSAGTNHSLALKSNGSVIAWGENNASYKQTEVPVAAQSGVIAIAAGGLHSLALKSDGSVVAWGADYFGQSSVPSSALSGVVKIAAGRDHSLALKSDGSVVAWGSNSLGQASVPAAALSGVIDIAGGRLHSLALKENDVVVGWGESTYSKTTPPTPPATYTVTITDTTGGSAVTIPAASAQALADSYVLARIAPVDGLHIPVVTGCGGTLKGSVYQTALLSGDCTVTIDPFVDTTPPRISSILPLDGSYVTSSQATISGVADDDVGVTSLSLNFNGSDYPLTVGSDGTFSQVVDLPTKTLYTLILTATDAAGNSKAVSQKFTYLTGWVKINNGAAATKTQAVTLSFFYPQGAKDMRLLYNDTAWGNWEAYPASGTKSITLPAGYGNRTVSVQFRTAGGTVSEIFSSSIFLDSATITGTIAINDGAYSVKTASTTDTDVTLSLSVAAPVEPVTMRFSTDAKAHWTTSEPFAATKTLPVPSGVGTRTVYVEYKDAGGQTVIASDSIVFDAKGPVTGTAGGISISGGAPYTTSGAVTVTLTRPDTTYTHYSLSTDPTGKTWTAFTVYTPTKGITLPAGDGIKTVYVQYSKSSTLSSPSAVYADSIILDTTVPTGKVIINNGAKSTGSATVNLTLAAADVNGIDKMQLSNTGTDWATAPLHDFATSFSGWTLTAGSGTKTVYARFIDKAGKPSANATAKITLDLAAPTGTLSINKGAAYTSSRSVQLAVTAAAGSGALYMQFSTDDIPTTWTDWEPYATATSLTLPAGDGPKTVHARFKDLADNVSAAISDSIVLDTVKPGLTLLINGGADWTNKTAVTLGFIVDDANPAAQMQFSSDNKTWTSWAAFTPTKAWTLAAGTGARTVYARVSDGAGNQSDADSAQITIETIKPAGTVAINGGATLTNSVNVTLALNATDEVNGSGIASMQFSNNGTAWSAAVPYATSAPWTIDKTNGTRTVYVRFLDHAGNVSANATDTITLDSLAPALTLSSYPAQLVVGNGLTLTGTNESGATMAVEAPVGVTADLTQPTATTWSCAVSGLLAGANAIAITATDGAGNTATQTATITYAPYSDADLTGTWYLEGISSAGPPEGISSGTLVIGDDGIVTAGGSLTRYNQTSSTFASGTLTIADTGVVSGSMTTGAADTLTIVGAALDSGKKLLALTVTISGGEKQLLLATRQNSGVATADLAGQWTYVGAATGAADATKNGNLKGAFTLSSTGVMSAANYQLNTTPQSAMTGSLTAADASGTLAGTMTAGTTAITVDTGALHAGGQMLQFVATSNQGQALLVTALRNGGTFAAADAAGTWRLYGLAASGTGEGSLDGAITLSSAAKVTGGTLHQLPADATTNYTGGALTVTSTGTFTGTLTVGATTAVTIETGKLHSGKQLMTLRGKTATGDRIFLVGVKEPL
jgi:alpha-tubulin suppressor-like RCC1 family protein